MTATGGECGGLSVLCNGLLRLKECGYGFECHSEIDVLSVGNAALYASAIVGEGGDTAVPIGNENVILLASELGSTIESHAILEAFHGIDAEHGIAQSGMQFVKRGLAPTYGAALYYAGNHSANGVALGLYLHNQLFHSAGGLFIGATHIAVLNAFKVVVFICALQRNWAYLLGVCLDADSQFLERQHGKGATHYATDVLAGRTSAAATMVADAIFGCIGEVGMAGAEQIAHVLIVGGMLVGIVHHKADGLAGGAPFKRSAEYLYPVGLLACRGEPALSGTAAVKLVLDKVQIHGNAWRHSVYDASDGLAVAFSKSGYPI